MKKIIVLLFILLIAVGLCSACNNIEKNENDVNKYGLIIYVSTDGNDQNDGTKDSPLASVNGAVRIISQIKSTSGLPDGGIKVEFSAGRYRISETIDYTEEIGG